MTGKQPPDQPPGEFELINKFFAPLAAANEGALGLRDDAALIGVRPGYRLVATVDTLVAGVHFQEQDPAGLIARKLLRVNLSDLAAMAAEPVCYLLAISLPNRPDAAWIGDFAAGLAADQAEFGIILAGGDTTATPGPLSLSLTALGQVPEGGEIRRSGAAPGQDIYVSGTIGDAALAVHGIEARGGELAADFAARYRLPQPRVALGPRLRGLASSLVDVSDGLVADLGHICQASGVAADLEVARLPVSDAARAALAREPQLREIVLTGGDDYELLFTADTAHAGALADLARETGVPLSRIGHTHDRTGEGAPLVTVKDEAGEIIGLKSEGYHHF